MTADQNMKILVFGFKPYRNYKGNITEKIIKLLRDRSGLSKTVLPVQFDKKIFLKAVEKHKPDVVLGLGMHPRAKKIRIERRAKNIMRRSAGERLQKIENSAPTFRFVNLKLKPDSRARITYNAGDYVCNFCMYILSDIAEKKGIRFAFLHIPKDYKIKNAVKFIEEKIEKFLRLRR